MSLADRLLYFSLGMAFALQVMVIIKEVKGLIDDKRKFKAWEAEMEMREKELAAKYRKIRENMRGEE